MNVLFIHAPLWRQQEAGTTGVLHVCVCVCVFVCVCVRVCVCALFNKSLFAICAYALE